MESIETKNINIEEVWKEYALSPSVELKNELVLHYLYLVNQIVFRLLPTYEAFSSYDDLTSCGVLGLMDAIDKFDSTRAVKFEHYATLRIRGEIIDQMRKQDWAPYSLRSKIKNINNAYNDMEMKLGREPLDVEVADHLNMDVDDIQKTMRKSHIFNLIHFEGMINEFQTLGDVVVDDQEGPEEQVENKEIVRVLGDLIEKLPKREKMIITLYYYEELTLREVAQVLDMSESRVSQVMSRVILNLRKRMEILLNL